MLQVLFEADGRSQAYTLVRDQASFGRASDNDIVLNDFSVSRRHAYLKNESGSWVIHDNQSTNGVRVNDQLVPRAAVKDGDEAVVGIFLLRFREEQPAEAPAAKRPVESRSTCIRPISEFNEDFGLEKSAEA